jgi:Flp pilus assembly protein TadG
VKALRHRERGATLAETSIVIGLVLAMIFGVIDFGRALYTYGFVAQLAREGARWAIVRGSSCSQLSYCNPTNAQLQAYLQSQSLGVTNANGIAAQIQYPSCPYGASGDDPGCTAQVTVSYPFAFIAPFVSEAQISMSSTSAMVISN